MVAPAHLVGIGGAVGAVARHALGRRLDREAFPAGTLAVNVLGTFLLAGITFLGADQRVLLLVGTGACGSFTTFSSFSVETVQLYERGDRRLAIAYAVGSLAGAVAAIGVAWGLVALLR